MERFSSALRSRVFVVLTPLFAFLSALCRGGCFGHRPGLAKGGPLTPAPSYGCPLVLEKGQQDPCKHKLLQVGGFSSCVCSVLHRSGGARSHSTARGCSVQPLPCAPAVSVLSLGCCCRRSRSGGSPALLEEGLRRFFQFQMANDTGISLVGHPYPGPGSLAAALGSSSTTPPLPVTQTSF